MTTNAQAALQAAATIYAAGHGHTNQCNVLQAAANFKDWLDNADRQTPARLQGSADRRGTGKQPAQCQAIGAGTVCYYEAGHEAGHSWDRCTGDGMHGGRCILSTGHDGAHI